jgi:hypothetical protein
MFLLKVLEIGVEMSSPDGPNHALEAGTLAILKSFAFTGSRAPPTSEPFRSTSERYQEPVDLSNLLILLSHLVGRLARDQDSGESPRGEFPRFR